LFLLKCQQKYLFSINVSDKKLRLWDREKLTALCK
jgi:hypothetical protein